MLLSYTNTDTAFVLFMSNLFFLKENQNYHIHMRHTHTLKYLLFSHCLVSTTITFSHFRIYKKQNVNDDDDDDDKDHNLRVNIFHRIT